MRFLSLSPRLHPPTVLVKRCVTEAFASASAYMYIPPVRRRASGRWESGTAKAVLWYRVVQLEN